MSARQRVVALMGTLVLAFGPVALQAPMAAANPDIPSATQINDFPFDGKGLDDTPSQPPNGKPKPDERGDKAEKLGGGVVTKVIDLVAGITKCALNIASPSVKCQL
ncbi:hypothetical protein [Nocardia sp. NPDC052566]|uniref:hypothetical protein n=1 Tax=Nocardia sp. NPDC052566 TaxID=3364330 RepID=UPI0037C751B1